MIEACVLLLSWLVGAILGTFFFGGLWWTVRKAVSSDKPALWILASLVLRMTVALGGFLLVANRSWQRMVFCMLGFVVARMVVMRITRPSTVEIQGTMTTEASIHAS